jgi:hypothetical protein
MKTPNQTSFPASAASRRVRTRKDRTTDLVMGLIVSGIGLMAALPFLDLLGYV